MIAKQMEIRSNIKEYFDMAFSGEAIIVPRKENKNVVIISEAEYNRLIQLSRVVRYESRTPKDSDLIIHNKNKLARIRDFKENWNGNGAPSFSVKLLDKIESIIVHLEIQPEIFPTAMGTIQLEYDNSRRDHMEIEISESDMGEIFMITFNGEEHYDSIPVTIDKLNERVAAFYG